MRLCLPLRLLIFKLLQPLFEQFIVLRQFVGFGLQCEADVLFLDYPLFQKLDLLVLVLDHTVEVRKSLFVAADVRLALLHFPPQLVDQNVLRSGIVLI